MNRFAHDSESTGGIHSTDDDELAAAYVFGELDPSERAAFERRLEAEPDLRGRCETFASVSRRVRNALDDCEVLSAATHAGLALASKRAATPPVRFLPIAVAAAALVATALFLLDASTESNVPLRKERARELALATDVRAEETLMATLDAPTLDPWSAYPITTVTGSTESPPSATLLSIETPAIRRIDPLPSTPLLTIQRSTSSSDLAIRARVEALYAGLAQAQTAGQPTGNPDGTNPEATLPVGLVLDDFGTIPDGVGMTPPTSLGNLQNESIWQELPNGSTVNFFFGGFLNPTHDEVASTANPAAGHAPADGTPFLPAWQIEVNPDAATILRDCERRPNERPSDMFFRFWGDNAFERTALDPQSTFAIDVDRASYALARAYLDRGVLPEKAQIRTEEFLNYFRPDVTAPTDRPIAVGLELAPSPFSSDRARSLLRVTLRARDLAPNDRTRQNLMLVVDVSGSMKEGDRLELVKHALRLLVGKLRDDDRVGLTTFSDEARLVLPMTAVSDHATIESAIHSMSAAGNTNAAAGLAIGFDELAAKYDVEAENRVVLFSDGVANVGATDADSILGRVAERRSKGIYLSTIGVGMNNHNDALLEQLADRGDGTCSYVDSDDEAKRAIVDRFSGALVTIARDVKVQVQFDPRQVERYRLLGYENRAVADQDFRNDSVDAGEFGAGEQVTALYELEIAESSESFPTPPAEVRVRWLPPLGRGSDTTESTTTSIVAADSFASASAGFRRSALVAQFAEFLRRSTHTRGDSIDSLLSMAKDLAPILADPEFDEFVALVAKSRDLVVAALPTDDPLAEAIDAVRKNRILRAEIEDLARSERADVLKQLEDENRRLEELLKKLLAR